MGVENPLPTVVDGEQSAPIREASARFVLHCPPERHGLKTEGPKHRLVCLLAQRNGDPRCDYLNLPAKEMGPAVLEPLPLHLRLQTTLLEAEDGVREEHAPCIGAVFGQGDFHPDPAEQPLQRSHGRVPEVVQAAVRGVVADIAPVLADDHEARIEVPVEPTPGANLVRIELRQLSIGRIAQPDAEPAPLPLSDQR